MHQPGLTDSCKARDQGEVRENLKHSPNSSLYKRDRHSKDPVGQICLMAGLLDVVTLLIEVRSVWTVWKRASTGGSSLVGGLHHRSS